MPSHRSTSDSTNRSKSVVWCLLSPRLQLLFLLALARRRIAHVSCIVYANYGINPTASVLLARTARKEREKVVTNLMRKPELWAQASRVPSPNSTATDLLFTAPLTLASCRFLLPRPPCMSPTGRIIHPQSGWSCAVDACAGTEQLMPPQPSIPCMSSSETGQSRSHHDRTSAARQDLRPDGTSVAVVLPRTARSYSTRR